MSKPAEDALDHDDGGIDNQAKIYRADRQKVGGFAAHHEYTDGEKQRERNGRADDDGAAQVAEEHPLQQEDQPDPERHVVEDRPSRDVDELLAIVDALDPHAGRKNVVMVDALDLLLDPPDGRHALLATAHQDDALHDIVVIVLAGNAETRLVPDDDLGDVLHQHGVAADLGQHGVVEIVERADEANAAHHRRLASNIERVAADIDVAVVERLQDLRKRQAVGHQLVDVDLQLEDFGLAAPPGHVDDSGHRPEPPLQHPILQGLEIEHAVSGRPHELVSIDLADRTDRRDLRLHVVRQRWKLRQAIEDLLQGFVVGVVEAELQLYIREPVKRDRSDRREIAHGRGLRLDRDGDVALDLLGREARALRHHIDHGRRRIRIGLDVELAKRHNAAREYHHEQHQHQHPVPQRKLDQRIHRRMPFAPALVVRF